MDTNKDYYRMLGVAQDADIEIIKAAYRVLAKRYHPDSNVNGNKFDTSFKETQEAYEVLSDTYRRCEYDALRDAQTSKSSDHGVGTSDQREQTKRPASPPVNKKAKTTASDNIPPQVESMSGMWTWVMIAAAAGLVLLWATGK